MANTRSAKSSMDWYCEKCKCITSHEVIQGDKDECGSHELAYGIDAYVRLRHCRTPLCRGSLTTAEVDETKLRHLIAERDSLLKKLKAIAEITNSVSQKTRMARPQ